MAYSSTQTVSIEENSIIIFASDWHCEYCMSSRAYLCSLYQESLNFRFCFSGILVFIHIIPPSNIFLIDLKLLKRPWSGFSKTSLCSRHQLRFRLSDLQDNLALQSTLPGWQTRETILLLICDFCLFYALWLFLGIPTFLELQILEVLISNTCSNCSKHLL